MEIRDKIHIDKLFPQIIRKLFRLLCMVIALTVRSIETIMGRVCRDFTGRIMRLYAGDRVI